MDETRYDILIPVAMYPAMGFYGAPARAASTNNEKAFSLLTWLASFHDAASGNRYIIVRTNCLELEARDVIKKIISALPFVSAILDAGLRVTSNQIMVGSYDVDINKICLFESGISPHPYGGSGDLEVKVSHRGANSSIFRGDGRPRYLETGGRGICGRSSETGNQTLDTRSATRSFTTYICNIACSTAACI